MPDPVIHDAPYVLHYVIRDTCRVCGPSGLLVDRLSLGPIPINGFPLPDEPLPEVVPLTLAQCPRCALVQLRHEVPLTRLYRTYWYKSGINETMVRELADVVTEAEYWLAKCCAPTNRCAWVDIGANDGTLLRLVGERLPALQRVAWEPALNLYETLKRHAEVISTDFFPPCAVDTSYGALHALQGRARVVTTIAMFYDLPDPNAFVAAVKTLLHQDGVWILQLQDLASLIEQTAFDGICHEHLEYYSVWALSRLFWRHGLHMVSIAPRAINGGSLRIVVKHGESAIVRDRPLTPWFDRELKLGLHQADTSVPTFARFAQKMTVMRTHLQAILQRAGDMGLTVDAYGASTKGNVLLAYCGFDPEAIRQVLDRSPEKWGRRTVTGIPIVGEAEGRREPAEVLLVLIWQFREALLQREAGLLEAGCQFLFPLPHAEIVKERR